MYDQSTSGTNRFLLRFLRSSSLVSDSLSESLLSSVAGRGGGGGGGGGCNPLPQGCSSNVQHMVFPTTLHDHCTPMHEQASNLVQAYALSQLT